MVFPASHAPSQTALLSPLSCPLLQATAAAVALLLALLASRLGLKPDHQSYAGTAEHMQQREVYLRQEMTRLLQEAELRRASQEAMLLSALQQWPFWTLAGATVLLAGLCRVARAMKAASYSCSE